MAKTKAVQARFPRTVYVRWEGDDNADDGGFLVVDATADPAEHGEQVAIYEFRKTKRMKITRELVAMTAGRWRASRRHISR